MRTKWHARPGAVNAEMHTFALDTFSVQAHSCDNHYKEHKR